MKQVFVYLALAAEDRVLGGVLNAETGALDFRCETPTPWGPETLATDSARRFLFVGCYPRYHPKDAPPAESRLYSFRIDGQTGALASVNCVPLPAGPNYLSVDRTDQFLLSTYYRAGKAAVHRIGPDGALGDATQWIDSGGGVHAFQVDPSNRYAFLAHVATSWVNLNTWPPLMSANSLLPSASNTILQYRFDAKNGILTPNAPFKLAGERGGGPRHFCYHPNLNVVYFSNEQGCAVTAYTLDQANGTLTPFQHVSTLPPEGYDGYASCSDLQIARSGRSLFVLNRGLDSVACFSVDPASGRLKLTQLAPTEAQSHTLKLSPDDRFLFVAGHESGRLATYSVLDDGSLDQIAARPIGKRPKCIVIVESGEYL